MNALYVVAGHESVKDAINGTLHNSVGAVWHVSKNRVSFPSGLTIQFCRVQELDKLAGQSYDWLITGQFFNRVSHLLRSPPLINKETK